MTGRLHAFHFRGCNFDDTKTDAKETLFVHAYISVCILFCIYRYIYTYIYMS